MEIWKDIPGYEGLYEVSNLGNVKSLNYNNTKKEKLLKQVLTKDGYFASNLSSKNNSRTIKNHQLVAMAFLEHKTCGMKLIIDHINDDKLDNRVENLQIVTPRFNAFKTQLKYSSKYKGVSWCNTHKKWLSKIHIKDKRLFLGYFNCELAAHQAYQNKLKTL
jgi:hypothetical protein